MLKQPALSLPPHTRWDASDFMLTSANQVAVQGLWALPQTRPPLTLLLGPKGSGKSHLLRIFAQKHPAAFITLEKAPDSAPFLILEDAPEALRTAADEEALFHLINHTRAERQSLILCAPTAPNFWPTTLPDLRSRLNAALPLVIEEADEVTLHQHLFKLFAERQLSLPSHILTYLLSQCERSYAGIEALVSSLDHYALSSKRKITLPLIREYFKEEWADEVSC